MRIDPKELICGVRPAALKALFRRDRFDTLQAMAVLELSEPAISRTLAELEASGWIQHKATEGHVDYWEITDKALRLTATRLIKRFPVREGRAVVDRVIAEARAVNADPMGTRRVTEVVLFGSVLTGADDDDAGDIDLIVRVQRRRLDEEQQAAVDKAEEARMPARLQFFDRLFWGDNQVLRRIKKVSRKITLHQPDDLALTGAPHRTVYAFDIDREEELTPDTTIKSLSRRDKPKSQKRASSLAKRQPLRDNWPIAPNEPPILPITDIEDLRRIQHMWANGAPVQAIAKRARLPRQVVEGYLASRRDAVAPSLTFDGSLRRTVSQVLRPDRRPQQLLHARLTSHLRGEPFVEANLYDMEKGERLVNIRRFTRLRHFFHGQCDLLPIVEPVNDAAWFWLERLRPRVRGVGLEVASSFRPDDRPEALSSPTPVDFASLGPPMLAALDQIWPRPREEYSGYDIRLYVSFGARISIEYWNGRRRDPEATSRKVRKAEAPGLWKAVSAFYERWMEVLDDGGTWAVFVEGSQIEDA